ncbi:hypothetical protein ACFTXJ_15080 [Streptomyces zhihengii]|uniref:hypothetical protein n=1 Tax=Streptomyces zhihengii TaxID=1818004 RepID=UPI003629671B
MSAPTPAGPDPEGRGLQPSAFGRPSPALLERADRRYAHFLAAQAPAADHDQDHDPAGAR